MQEDAGTRAVIDGMSRRDAVGALRHIAEALGSDVSGELLRGYFAREATPEMVRAEVGSRFAKHPSEYEEAFLGDDAGRAYRMCCDDPLESTAMWAMDRAVEEQVPRLAAMQRLGMDAEMEDAAEAVIDLLLNGGTVIGGFAGEEFAAATAGKLRTGIDNGDIWYCFCTGCGHPPSRRHGPLRRLSGSPAAPRRGRPSANGRRGTASSRPRQPPRRGPARPTSCSPSRCMRRRRMRTRNAPTGKSSWKGPLL